MLKNLAALGATILLALPAAAYDHADFEAILKQVVKGTKVDYAAVTENREQLKAYITRAAEADLSTMKGKERAAFLVNAYNANVLEAVVAAGLPGTGKGVLDVPGFFDKKTYKVAGKSYTLNKLEEQVRPPKGPASVHFVVNCASISCPPLASYAYTADNWGNSLFKQTKAYLGKKGEVEINDEAKTITVVKLFEWYNKDFGGDEGARKFLAKYGYKQALDPAFKIVTRDYDWKLNSK